MRNGDSYRENRRDKKEAGRDHHEPHGQEVDSDFPPACHLHIQYSIDGRKMQEESGKNIL